MSTKFKLGMTAIALSLAAIGVWRFAYVGMIGSSYDLGNGLELRAVRRFESAPRTTFSQEVSGVAWSSDGAMLASYSNYGNLITIWSSDGKKLNQIERRGTPYVGNSIAFLDRGKSILAPATDRSMEDNRYSLDVWDVQTARIVERAEGLQPDSKLQELNRARQFAVSSDGNSVAVIGAPGPPLAIIYDRHGWQISQTYGADVKAGDGYASAIAYSPDGKYLAVGREQSKLSIFDLSKSPVSQHTIDVYAFRTPIIVGALAFSPDGMYLATGAHFSVKLSSSGNYDPIKIWRLSDYSLVTSYPIQHKTIWDLTWSADGHYLAAAISPNSIGVFLAGAPVNVSSFADLGSGYINSVRFSPNGHQLAVGGGEHLLVFSIDPH